MAVTSEPTRPGEGRSQHPVVRLGRDGIRAWGQATARWRSDPEFLVIGAKRGGSTSFYYDLARHPQIAPLFPRPDHLPKAELTKGVHYFDVQYDRGARWYRSHLPSTLARRRLAARSGDPVVTGEASPYYLFHPAAAQRAAALVPHATDHRGVARSGSTHLQPLEGTPQGGRRAARLRRRAGLRRRTDR